MITLHINRRAGHNAHHVAEACFKATARALARGLRDRSARGERDPFNQRCAVKVWTAHEKPQRLAGPRARGVFVRRPVFWSDLAGWHAAPGLAGRWLVLLAILLIAPSLTRPRRSSSSLGLALLVGFSGRDLVRWSVARRGYLEIHVVTGRNEDEAQARLLAARPDLVERSMVAETAP